MPINIRFPAPGSPLGKQIITPLSNFSGLGFDGGSFKNILLYSENQGSSTWVINTGTSISPLADGTTVVTYAPKVNNAISWYQGYELASDTLTTELVNHGALPAINGVPFVGQTLTVTTGTWYGDSISFSYQWQRGTVNIAGATSSTYVIDPADEKFKLRCLVIASTGVESTISKSTSTAVIAGAPLDTSPPVLSGTQTIGSTLSVTTGTWTADTALTFTYQWLRTGVATVLSTASTYVIQSLDAGYTLSCTVTATNTRGAYNSTSSNYTGIISGAPVNTLAPIASGSIVLGGTLSAYDGLWVGYPTPTFTYQWQQGTTDIVGATASTYVSVVGDVSYTIRVKVTATNLYGSSSTYSNSTLAISTVPANTVAPVVSGNLYVGQTLSVTNGTWTGSPAPTYQYQWKRNGGTITGANASTYVLTPSDYNYNISCTVTAVNQAGSTSADSNSVGLITQLPQYLTQPVLSGTPTRGQTLSVNTGTWSTNVNLTYTYQWYRGGVSVSTQTSATYLLSDVDLGSIMTATVAATNIAGTTTATSSNSLGPVVGIPQNTVLPVITGTNVVGQTLSVTDGTWTGYPAPTYTYQWKRGGTPISLATNNTYVLVSADATYTITCTVTATNSQGATPVTTTATSSINETVSNTAVPTVSGLLYVGQTLVTTTGTWIGTPGPTYTFQWQRVTTPIAGATSSSYVLTTADVGYTLRSSVTATNVVNSATAYSVQTSSVSGLPYTSVQPLITSTSTPYVPGMVLTVNTGTFLGATPISVTQQWYRVASTGTVAIAGATGLNYTISSDDIGMNLTTISTATNSYGTTSTTASNSLLVPPVIPTNAMIMYNGTDPALAGWSRYTTADGLVIKGASVQGDIGVTSAAAGTYSATYTVPLAGAHTGPSNYWFYGGATPGSASYAPVNNSAGAHNHSFSLTGSAAPARPPRTQHTLLYATSDQYQFPVNTIHIHASNVGGSWTQKLSSGANRFIIGGNGVSDLAAVDAVANNAAGSSTDGSHDHITGATPTRISSSPATPSTTPVTPASGTGQLHSHSVGANTVPLSVSSIAGKLMKLWTAASQDVAFNGHIVMFVGTLSALPSYWKLCDGTNGTPDLRTYSLGYSTSASDHNVATSDSAQSAAVSLSSSWTHQHATSAPSPTPSTTSVTGHQSATVSHTHSAAATPAPLSGYDPGSIKVAFIQYVAP